MEIMPDDYHGLYSPHMLRLSSDVPHLVARGIRPRAKQMRRSPMILIHDIPVDDLEGWDMGFDERMQLVLY
jgi:hypothetical protein